MVGMSAGEVRAMIAEFGGVDGGTLRRGVASCLVTVAIVTPGSGGAPAQAQSMTQQDSRRAYIAAVDNAGAPIAIVPKFGDRLERGANVFGLGKVRTMDPDGSPLCYIAEIQG